MLSLSDAHRDENLLEAALCLWDNATNTFDFRVGSMTLTLLDMAQIFCFRPHERPMDAQADYERKVLKDGPIKALSSLDLELPYAQTLQDHTTILKGSKLKSTWISRQ